MNDGVQLDQYYDQVQWQLVCTQRKWCHLISFDPELPEYLQIYCKEITLDEEWKERAESAVIAFNAEIETILTNLKELNYGNNA